MHPFLGFDEDNKSIRTVSKALIFINLLSILGISETSPLHQYNLTGDVGDDEVFMVRMNILLMLKRNLH